MQSNWPPVQSRAYAITFGGEEYQRDMPENPGNRELFPGVKDRASLLIRAEDFFQDARTREVYTRLEECLSPDSTR